jgi:hypothetical protein
MIRTSVRLIYRLVGVQRIDLQLLLDLRTALLGRDDAVADRRQRGQNVWHASSDGWPKKLNHSNPLLAPDGVAFPLPSNSPTAQRRQEYPWTAGQSLILLRFPENRHLPSPSHHPIIR